MHSEWKGDRNQRVFDALSAIANLRSFLHGMTREKFDNDRKTQSAVERELEIISEACTHLTRLVSGPSLDEVFPAVPWHQIKGIGNRLRHEYGRIDAGDIWDTVTTGDLDALQMALETLAGDVHV